MVDSESAYLQGFCNRSNHTLRQMNKRHTCTAECYAGHIRRDRDKSSDQHAPPLLYMHYIAMVASIKKEHQKSYHHDTMHGLRSSKRYCPDVDLRGQWRKFYHGIVTTKTCCVNNDRSLTGQWYLQSFPTSVCLNDMQASVTVWWVYSECTNFVNNIVHRILHHVLQAKTASCQTVLSAVHWL